MDGFEIARFIRAKEKMTGGHIPLIALTAYALKGDRERCLEAGMDDYLSKPVRARELVETIENFVPASIGSKVFDPDNPAAFFREAPYQLQKLKEAISTEDESLVERRAHKLKGIASNAGVNKIADDAFRIQLAARKGNMALSAVFLEEIEREFGRVHDRSNLDENKGIAEPVPS